MTNVRKCTPDECLTIFTNGGSQLFEKLGQLKLFPMTVHFNPDSMANILSMKHVAAIPGVRVTYDSIVEKTMFVHFNGYVYKFRECSEGLYYYDVNKGPEKCAKVCIKVPEANTSTATTMEKDKLNASVTPYSFLSTVNSNKV